MRRAGAVLFVAVLFIFLPVVVLAANDHSPEVKVYSSGDLKLESVFFSFLEQFRGGQEVTTGDLTGDGVDEVVVGAGIGGGPQVRALTMSGASAGFNHFVFHSSYRGGVDVAVGDVDGDGQNEVVVSQLQDEGRVKVYESDGTVVSSFLPYGAGYSGGAHVAVGDVTGDGIADIVTGTGVGSRSHVRSFDRMGNFSGVSIFPFAGEFTGGVDVAVGQVVSGGREEIVIGADSAGGPQVVTYQYLSGEYRVAGSFFAYNKGHRGGVNVAVGDVNRNGDEEILTGVGSFGGPHVRAFEMDGSALWINLFPFPADMRGGVNVAIGDLDGDTTLDIVTAGQNARQVATGGEKKIVVDLSEQRLRAYEGDREVQSFLISSGIARFPSPVGNFAIQSKIPLKRYQWSYGPGNPNNYNLPNVKWNMKFFGPYYFHTAYWHNNFGRPMSHGCINISEANAKALYDWAEVGTSVEVRY